MKKLVLLVLCSLVVIELHAQSILVANNNPGAALGTDVPATLPRGAIVAMGPTAGRPTPA